MARPRSQDGDPFEDQNPNPRRPVPPGMPPADDEGALIEKGPGEVPPDNGDLPEWDPKSRMGESPRERAALRRPEEPTPMAGSAFVTNPIPSEPLGPSVGGIMPTRLRSRGMFGTQGGLLEGGLGEPFDPTPNNQSDPISTLISALLNKGPRRLF